ncbi:hypothetical protein B6I21_03045, partial [candidate division KSB1 bacterium 4572_119]
KNKSIEAIRQDIIAKPILNVPAWTVALLDPTTGTLPRRKTDINGTIKYSEAIANTGAPGVLFAASTGWGHVRNFQEHRTTLKTGGDAKLGSTLKQALIRIEDPLEQNLRLLKELNDWGYAIVWTRRGANLPPDASDSEVADNLLPIAKAAAEIGLPMGVYSISTVDGACLRPSAVKLLLEKLGKDASRFVVAVKITEPVFEESTQLFLEESALENKKIVQGWDAFYTRAMQAGKRADGLNQCGATSGAAACMVKAFDNMYKFARAEDWSSVAQIQKAVTEAFYSMQGVDKDKFPDLQIAKFVMGLGHPLTEERTFKDGERLVSTVEKLVEEKETQMGGRLIAESLLIMGKGEYASPFYGRLNKLIND